jgi:hypothetical protein
MALAESHISRVLEYSFNNVIEGKGRGLIVLLQYCPSFLIESGNTNM